LPTGLESSGERYFSAHRPSQAVPRGKRRALIILLLALAALPRCLSQTNSGANGYYLVMDLTVSSRGTVAFYGETNRLPVSLDPRLGSLAPKDGRFANTTDLLTTKDGLNWTLRLAMVHDYSNVFINVYLPVGASVMSVSPGNWTILPDKKSLVVNFQGSFRSGDELCIRYQLGGGSSPKVGGYAITAIGAAGICAVAVVGFKLLWPRFRPSPPVPPVAIDQAKMDAILPTLNERERLVLEAIVKEGGRVSQRKLKHICDLPKSTLSRVTDELQRKGLVRKIPVGQTNELRVDERLLSNG